MLAIEVALLSKFTVEVVKVTSCPELSLTTATIVADMFAGTLFM